MPDGLEQVFFEQVEDRNRALVLHVRRRAADRLVQHDIAEPQVAIGLHPSSPRLRRMATDRAWASRPSDLASAIAAGPRMRN